MSDPSTSIEPDAAMMRRHVGHLFEGWLDGCQDGRVELAWTDARDGRLRHAAIFGTDDLDELVERAAAENSKPGQNVYVGQALRHPNIAPFGRCRDEDFYALTAFYTDIDDDIALAAGAEVRRRGCLATGIVATGCHPHLRVQMLWRLEAPLRDPDDCRRQNLAIAQALGGDTSVVNPGRVLRLGGSIAWPRKPGRIIERTAFRLLDDGRPLAHPPARVAMAFPPAAALLMTPPVAPPPAVDWAAPNAARLADRQGPAPARPAQLPHAAALPAALPVAQLLPAPGTAAESSAEFCAESRSFEPSPSTAPAPAADNLNIGTTNVSVEACLARIRAGDHWHDNLVRLTGHWIARGWSDAEILTAAEALTLPGYTIAASRREVAQMIVGGRRKWSIADPEPTFTEQQPRPFVLEPVGLLEPSKRPPRDWLVRHRLMRKHTTVTAAAPGVGKSTLTIEEAVSLASGRDFLGFGIDRPRKVAVINNEETRDELERRIEATCMRFDVPFEAIAETLYLHSGVDAEKFIVARRGPNDSVVVQVQARQLSEFLRDEGIDLLVIDPFVQVHTVAENSNEEIEQVMMALRAISVDASCALHLVHHTRKPPAGTSHQAGDIFAVRGGGAIVGDAHFVFTLADMGSADADALGVADEERKKFIRLDDAKGKLAPPSGALWFERAGVTMPYGLLGENVGVLVPRLFGEETSAEISTARVVQILREIEQRWRDGNPFSASPQSPRYVVPTMVQSHGCSQKAARSLLRNWLTNGMVASLSYDKHNKAQGLKVLEWPG